MEKLQIVILAAGEGKRMYSATPKVLHPIGGTPMLQRVINTAKKLQPEAIYIVYGSSGNQVKNAFSDPTLTWVLQEQQLGTGHAVAQALPLLPEDSHTLILYGDVPLITDELLKKLVTETPTKSIGLLTAVFENPEGFGRIIRDTNGDIKQIVEQKDAFPYQLAVHEINTGIMFLPSSTLHFYIPHIQNNNAQAEFYLTDLIALAHKDNYFIHGIIAARNEEIMGVNDHYQLANLERYYQHMLAKKLALDGSNITDPNRLDIRGNLTAGKEISIEANVLIEGNVTIGNYSSIGPNVCIANSTIGNNVKILANSVIDGAIIEDDCSIGPFARIRPGTKVRTTAKIGNFVEVKNMDIGVGSKANHLTYLGDGIIGDHVNIGAGTITCNYDGANKYQTIIEDGVMIGSNSSLVAPVKIGKNAYIGAGSTISEDAPPDQLTLARARQCSIKDWQRPKKK